MAFTIRDKPDKEREFSTLFGFNDRITFRSAELDEDVASADSLGGLPIHNINFYEGGVRVPFPKLLVDFLHYTNLTPTQLKPNTLKIVMGVDCLNQKLKTELGVSEIMACYKLLPTAKDKTQFYLQARYNEQILVTHLPDSCQSYQHNVVFVYGPFEIGLLGVGLRCPRRAGRPPTNINELPRSVNHADINKILGHKLDGFGRACHILLSYTPRYRSISSGSIPKGYPSLPTLRGKKSKVTSQQRPQVQELLEKAQSSSSSESLFGDREEIADQEISLPIPEPKKRERSAFREALRQAKKVDTIVQGLRKGSHIQARGSSNVLSVAEATIENVKLLEVTPVASAEASRAAEVRDSSLRRRAKKKKKKSTYIDKTLDQPTYEGSSRDKGKKALLESLPHFSTETSDQVSVKIKPEYTFKGIGPLLRFPADMLSLSKMASTDLSYEAFTHMMIASQHILRMGDLLTDQEKHKAQIRKLKKELASKKAAFSVLKDDYETTMATIKTISVELEEARTVVQKVNAELVEAQKETEGLKLGQKRWEDRFHKEVRTRERLISEVEERVREEVTREMALEVKEYEDKVYLQGWNTLLEKIRATFPSVDLGLISFERTEVPDEDYEALEKVPELTSIGPKTTIEDMPPEA